MSYENRISNHPRCGGLSNATILLAVGFGFTLWIFRDMLCWLWERWNSSEDYSHGMLIPILSLIILFVRRDSFPWDWRSSSLSVALGVAVVALGLGMRVAGIYTSILTVEALSIIPFLMGVVLISSGFRFAKWVAPSVFFLAFMVPLPHFVATRMSVQLQALATNASEFSLQTLGVPAVAQGNIIHLSNGTIGVAEACGGLRMLYAFFALSTAACLVLRGPKVEKALIMFSSVPIALGVNCLRIAATGLAYEYVDPEAAENVFHNLAGWVMMPLGTLSLLVVVAVFRRSITFEAS